MQPQPKNLYYDREHSLHELLTEVDKPRLERVLRGMAGDGARLLDRGGAVMAGPAQPAPGASRAPFRLDLETFGFVEGPRAAGLPAAVEFMEMLLTAVMRYYMVSAIHMEAVQADFVELQEKNTALQASEARFKALAEDLEVRVADQVKTIEATQRQLYQAEKLASVGQLAAGVAHEINNPLGFIRSNLNTASDYVQRIARLGQARTADADGRALDVAWREGQIDAVIEDFPALMQECIEGVTRVANIVSALRDFSSIDQAGEGMVDLNGLVRNAVQVAASEFGERVRLVTEFEALPAVRCHAGRLSQVIMNLLLNAVQAIPGEGEVRVTTSSDDKHLYLAVADTGHGMSEEIRARIFEPFYTTRDVGQGTGLGLTVARDVVQAHGGHIEVSSRIGAGTTFTVVLPLARHG
jgi:signal transduction histidine kinase